MADRKYAAQRPMFVAYFIDKEFREVRGLGVFDDCDKAWAYAHEMEQMARKNDIYHGMEFGVFRTTDRTGEYA